MKERTGRPEEKVREFGEEEVETEQKDENWGEGGTAKT